MKKYYVTVNGTRYEVEVEEVKGDFPVNSTVASTVSAEPAVVEPKAAPQKPAAENKAVEEKTQPTPAPAPKKEVTGGEKLECPMPGTILKVNVKEGDTFKKGDVLFVLEAMKMENEIMAPRDGKVLQIGVAKGAVVNTGDLLAVLE
jgi:glutaconyl-CoA/methylmalonyl-CoA decarboxylase subunit gamma